MFTDTYLRIPTCGTAHMIVPPQRHPDDSMQIKVATAIFLPMALFQIETDQGIICLEGQRAVVGALGRVESIFRKIVEEDRAATRAVSCHSRGEAAMAWYNNCE